MQARTGYDMRTGFRMGRRGIRFVQDMRTGRTYDDALKAWNRMGPYRCGLAPETSIPTRKLAHMIHARYPHTW